MAAKTGFETFAKLLKEMTPAYRAKLIENHQNFGRLRMWCEAKGYVKNLPSLQGLIVLKNTKEVKQLREIVDFLKAANFKWSYKDKKLQKKWEEKDKWEDELEKKGRKSK